MRSIRSLVVAAVSLVLVGTALAVPPRAAADPEDDVATIVSRLQEHYLAQGDEIIIANGIYLARTSAALDYVESQEPDGSWADVDYTDRTRSANGEVWSPYHALYRMLAMAQAYRDPSADGFEDPALLAGLERGLGYWDVADPGNDGWWEPEVGESIAMGRISVFVGDLLGEEAFDVTLRHNSGRLDPVGANGAWRTTNYLFEAIATEDADAIRAGFDTMVQTVVVDHSGEVREAVQPDASFWAHGAQLYSEGYGMALFTNIALWADAARGTGFAFSREHLDTIAFYMVEGTRWMIRGEIGMLYLGYRPPKTIEGVTSHASEFIEPLVKMVRTDPLYARAYQELLDGIMGTSRGNGVTGNRYFWRSELSSHLREDYAIVTRMNSSRTVGSEYRSTFRPEIGNEIVWSAQGATAIQVNNREYLDLGPTVDWFHQPGVTAPYTREQTRGTTGNGGSFTGGVSDGRYGASVHTLNRAQTRAQKSYFYFDDEMVALGAGITSDSEAAVHTTVNQGVAKDNASVDGTPVPAGTDAEAVEEPSWAYNDEIGYVFPAGGEVRVSNTTQTGSWLDSEPVSRDAFTLHLDHGVRPDGAGYEYVVLPGKTPEEVADYAEAPAVEVLRNDTDVQAVRHAGLERTTATFYRPGTLELGGGRTLEVSQPSIVTVDETGDVPVASVANPSQPGAVVHVSLTDGDDTAHGVFALGAGAELGRTVTAALSAGPEAASPYTASDVRGRNPAAHAGDGSDRTAWRSAGDGTAWLTKELDPGSWLTGVEVHWGPDAAERYLLQTSLDGETWTDQRFVSDGRGGREELELAPTQASFVRVLMVDGDSPRGYSIRELRTESSVNLALGADVIASGFNGGTTGSITDGSMLTRWSSNRADDAWVQVDLGEVRPIGSVRLWWEASYARQYEIQVSDDGRTWRDAHTTAGSGSDGGADLVDVDETARYLRVQTVQRSDTRYGISLWELEVFADDSVSDVPPAAPGRENLALRRPATADSAYNPTLAAGNATDGNPTSRWASQRQAAPYTTERWLAVDLGEPRPVNQVVVRWEAATSNDYRVEGSLDGTDWQELARVRKPAVDLEDVVDLAETEVRHLRLVGLPVTQYGWSVFELEVYGGHDLRCGPSPLLAGPDGTAVATASITPRDDVVAVTSLDEDVAAPSGEPRVDAEGGIEIDLRTGDPGSTSLLLTHTGGDAFARCPVVVAAETAELEQLVAEANALDSLGHTAASWAPVLRALQEAKTVLATSDATQSRVDDSATSLAAAIGGLVEV